MVRAAYIHVPFCVQKCFYCDFSSQAGCDALIPEWHKSVINEIKAVSNWSADNIKSKSPLKSVFFGGGTPSVVDPKIISDILELLNKCFGIDIGAEITIEANPGTISRENMFAYVEAGINRISLGLQAKQEKLLRNLGRIHCFKDFEKSVNLAFNAGISRISADIMIGLPQQSLENVKSTIDCLTDLPIEHVSYYSLILEEGTSYYDTYHAKPDLLPSEEAEREMYHTSCAMLEKAGIIPYEISNAARPGSECRHNLVYWHAEPYYGFGPAAHSFLNFVRRGNCTDINKYIALWQNENEAFAAADQIDYIDQKERYKEAMLLGFRLLKGISFEGFFDKYGIDLRTIFADELKRLLARSLIVIDDKSVRLSKLGIDVANQVFMEFV